MRIITETRNTTETRKRIDCLTTDMAGLGRLPQAFINAVGLGRLPQAFINAVGLGRP